MHKWHCNCYADLWKVIYDSFDIDIGVYINTWWSCWKNICTYYITPTLGYIYMHDICTCRWNSIWGALGNSKSKLNEFEKTVIIHQSAKITGSTWMSVPLIFHAIWHNSCRMKSNSDAADKSSYWPYSLLSTSDVVTEIASLKLRFLWKSFHRDKASLTRDPLYYLTWFNWDSDVDN